MDDFRGVFQYREPFEGSWRPRGWHAHAKGFMWENCFGVRAISSISLVYGKPQYHVSFSDNGKRIGITFMEAVLKQWRITDFEEDNHVPNGKVRNYWKPFDPEAKECRCKETEPPHEETGGYVWREAKHV